MNLPEGLRKLRTLFAAPTAAEAPNREAAIWAIRLFLGREPASEEEVRLHATHGNLESLRTAFSLTSEFQSFLRRLDTAGAYRIPLFMLEPPADKRLSWRFAPPSLKAPVTQFCTEGQFREPEFAEWCRALDLAPKPSTEM